MTERAGDTEANSSDSGTQQLWRRLLTVEVGGEIVLLAVVGAFFAYIVVQSFSWGAGAALLPRIVVAIGTPFWVLRIVALVRHTPSATVQIMDTGFRIESAPKGTRGRFVKFVSFVVLLYLGIWLLGFEIALPLGLFGYLYIYGKIGWMWSGSLALVLLAIIIGVYDRLLNALWHEPVIFTWLENWFGN